MSRKKLSNLAFLLVSLTLWPSIFIMDANSMLFTKPFLEARKFLEEIEFIQAETSKNKNKLSAKAFSWMLHYSKICWDSIFEKCVLRLVSLFGLKGFLVIDDTDRLRAKSTSKLFGIQKLKDKKTAGYSTGQNIILLLFVTEKMIFSSGISILYSRSRLGRVEE